MDGSKASTIADMLGGLKHRAAAGILIDGPAKLHGVVDVQGSKNAALKIIPALAAFPRVFRLRRVPVIIDTLELLSALASLGAEVRPGAEADEFLVDSRTVGARHLPAEITRRTTTAFYFAGALLGRFGSVRIGDPGGDEIGLRAIDLHLSGFRALGGRISGRDGCLNIILPADASRDTVSLALPSAGATVNVALAGLRNPAGVTIERSPVDADMAAFWDCLQRSGAWVHRDGDAVSCRLDRAAAASGDGPIELSCPADRNDAFTWLAVGALSEQGVLVRRLDVAELRPAVEVLAQLGGLIEEGADGSSLSVLRPGGGLSAPRTAVIAGPSPGFHSDWAPLLQPVLATAHGRSRTIDVLHSNRVRQADVLRAMGAKVTVSGGQPPPGLEVRFPAGLDDARYVVDIDGPAALHGAAVDVGNDVRACAAAVVAGTVAVGVTTISDAHALYRGYEDFLGRLARLGARVAPLR
ncbi:hypothetical protein [Dactylosporangium sp. CA-139066]|uniref:hypothetical protein n=1 Tax=Dactylosporangium sp. CA-139066 TaxID=3239930 RepID=UPI003D8D1944